MNSATGGLHIVVVGAGNIGSHLVPQLGRLAGVGRVTIIDRDRYEAANLSGQDILPADVGRPKAAVQARRLRRIHPQLAVVPICADVEQLPPGRLRGDAILAGVDNRRARQRIDETAWQLGVPWVDAAVDGAGLLARIGVYVPGGDGPCLECGWNENDYAALEQTYPCGGGRGRDAPATAAPASLGALAASLQALECRALFDPVERAGVAGRQIFVDARHHQYYCTVLRRNPHCRRRDHAVRAPAEIDLDPRVTAVGELLADHARLRVNDRRWVRQLVCGSCGATRAALRLLRGSLLDVGRACPRCGGRMQARGVDLTSGLAAASLSEAQKRRPLHALGIRRGDVLALEDEDGGVQRLRVTCHER